MLPRHIATRLTLIVLMVAPASACMFDCRFDATNPSPDPTICRGPTPALVTTTYPTTTYLRLKVSAGSLSVQFVDPVAMFVDLSNRSITDVAAGGLSCYQFVPHAYLQGDQWFNGPVSTTPLLRGVILDNNGLWPLLPVPVSIHSPPHVLHRMVGTRTSQVLRDPSSSRRVIGVAFT